MKLILIALLLFYTSTTESSILTELKENILSLFKNNDTAQKSRRKSNPSATRFFKPLSEEADDNELQYGKGSLETRRFEDSLSDLRDDLPSKLAAPLGISNEDIELRANGPGFRRFDRIDLNRNWIFSRSIGITSSSAEEKIWKKEYKSRWTMMKKDALQSHMANQSRANIVNMAAARPWRVPCGDTNQHDLAVGSCVMPVECPPELRIYRGDDFCGRNQFVCCSLQALERDLYEAFDPTMYDTSGFSTSSNEERKRERGSRENRANKRKRKRNKTIRARYRRKRYIKKTIRKIAKEVRKELNRAFRNSTANRRQVIHNLKTLIKKMKSEYKKERHIVKFQHDLDLANINLDLGEKLKKIRGLNHEYLTNDTFRMIIVNGTATRQGPSRLLEAYPELNSPEISDLAVKTRRAGGNRKIRKKRKRPKDYLEYDIEFGMLA